MKVLIFSLTTEKEKPKSQIKEKNMSEMTFEQAVKELEQITTALEAGKLGLEESMKYYEKGTKLADFCSKKLKEAELKIQQLSDVEEE